MELTKTGTIFGTLIFLFVILLLGILDTLSNFIMENTKALFILQEEKHWVMGDLNSVQNKKHHCIEVYGMVHTDYLCA